MDLQDGEGVTLAEPFIRSFRLIADRARTARKAAALRATRHFYIGLAPLYRRFIPATKFVGVTGTAGKTTTKDLIAAVLDAKYRVHKSAGSYNQLYTVAKTMCEARHRTEYCVQEIGAGRPGAVEQAARLLAPSIAVVTNVGSDHWRSLGDEDAIAAEKSKLVQALVPGGVAVLNADDPRVLAMAAHAPGETISFGTSAGADLRADHVVSEWPDGLRFAARYGGTAYEATTRLHGAHLLGCVLAAVGVGLAAGMALPECLNALRDIEAPLGRMSVHRTSEGIILIRDEWKAPYWSIRYPIEFMRGVPARRKLLVLGTISDYRGSSNKPYRDTVRHALEVVDEVVLVAAQSRRVEKVSRQVKTEAVSGFASMEATARYLRETVAPGDAVLFKGASKVDHISRLALIFETDVRCWRERCDKHLLCDACPLLSVPSGP